MSDDVSFILLGLMVAVVATLFASKEEDTRKRRAILLVLLVVLIASLVIAFADREPQSTLERLGFASILFFIGSLVLGLASGLVWLAWGTGWHGVVGLLVLAAFIASAFVLVQAENQIKSDMLAAADALPDDPDKAINSLNHALKLRRRIAWFLLAMDVLFQESPVEDRGEMLVEIIEDIEAGRGDPQRLLQIKEIIKWELGGTQVESREPSLGYGSLGKMGVH